MAHTVAPPCCTHRKSMRTLAAVCAYFNPTGAAVHRDNYMAFAAGVRAVGVDLYTVELTYGAPAVLPGSTHIVADPERAMLWQKERLLNYALTHIPDKYDAIAWLDTDIMFLRSGWPDALLHQLTTWQVVQPFCSTANLEQDGTLAWHRHSYGYAYNHARTCMQDYGNYHPGYAWAGRAAWLRELGLYEVGVTGSGDINIARSMVKGLAKHLDDNGKRTPGFAASETTYANALRKAGVQGCVTYLPGMLLHMDHGPVQQRQYQQRWAVLEEWQFDPYTDVEVHPAGYLQWTDHAMQHKAHLVAWVREYFNLKDSNENIRRRA